LGDSPIPRALSSIKINTIFFFKNIPHGTRWVLAKYHWEKNNMMHFQNGIFTFLDISFFEMPCKILHFINVSPNILRKISKVFTDRRRFGPK
jgi:hypothetical protein